ncbi:MAG: diadenylate cyclase CdaA, partial [Lachnospiraceae bacterium]|nr:diadenylate cyclase CdaA [Lachnospiraceae bacterium]
MNTFINAVKDYLDWIVFPKISITDVLEIFILAFLVYHVIVWVRNTRAWVLFKGIVIILSFALVAAILQLNVVLWIFSKTISVGIIAIFIVFQPELRRALEQLGSKNIMSSLFVFDDQEKNERFSQDTISEIVSATLDLAKSSMGALIVIEREVKLPEYESTGIKLDSCISSQLLINIFEKNTPLHDGAVLIRDNRVVAATCYLPLSDNKHLSKDMGTRHRA